jgi:biopolymer transport protein ExbD
MGAAVGTGGGKGDVNVDINVVPFIDLMSCLTAFLLFTAVWVTFKEIPTKPLDQSQSQPQDREDRPKAIILVAEKKIYIRVARGERVIESKDVGKLGEQFNWDQLEKDLTIIKNQHFSDSKDITVSAIDDLVPYQALATAMSRAGNANFTGINIVTPNRIPPRVRVVQ